MIIPARSIRGWACLDPFCAKSVGSPKGFSSRTEQAFAGHIARDGLPCLARASHGLPWLAQSCHKNAIKVACEPLIGICVSVRVSPEVHCNLLFAASKRQQASGRSTLSTSQGMWQRRLGHWQITCRRCLNLVTSFGAPVNLSLIHI